MYDKSGDRFDLSFAHVTGIKGARALVTWFMKPIELLPVLKERFVPYWFLLVFRIYILNKVSVSTAGKTWTS